MARTTEAAVLTLMMSPAGVTEAMVTPRLNTANAMVTNYLADEITDDDDLLEDIEKYLAAHLVAMSPKAREAQSERAGEVGATYMGKVDLGLNFTTYGMMAIAMDTSGTLNRINKGKRGTATFQIVSDIGEDRDYPNI